MNQSDTQVIRILRWDETPRSELTKQRGSHADVSAAVQTILHAVRTEGDSALFRFTQQFDHVSLSGFEVSGDG